VHELFPERILRKKVFVEESTYAFKSTNTDQQSLTIKTIIDAFDSGDFLFDWLGHDSALADFRQSLLNFQHF
jgi:hypothetical protein